MGSGACLAAFTGWRYARVSAPVNGPIVLISVDALRPDHLSTYGYSARKTPAIDRLATDGVVFERAYAHVPQTLPSHASLFTGKLPVDTGVRDTVGFTLADGERTLAEMLRDRGYATAAVVSSYALRRETGVDQGFTLFDDGPDSGTIDPEPPVRAGNASEAVAERWLDSAGTDRAFLFLHVAEPGGTFDTGASHSAIVSNYDDRIAAADAAVDQLLQHLEARQLYDRSTIIVVSDHGQGLGAQGEMAHGLSLGEQTLRIPLIVKTSEGRSKGVRVAKSVQLVDVVPTVLDLVKAPIPGGLRGRSLAPLFDDSDRVEERPIYTESLFGRYHFGWSDVFGIIDGKYQYITGPEPELYDLDVDPSARTNLAASQQEVVARMERLLAEFRAGDRPPAAEVVDAEARHRYERLGYVGTAGKADDLANDDPANKAAIVEQYRDAIRRLAADDVDGAIASFRTLTEMLPGSADVWTQLATTAAGAERHAIAVDAYTNVAAIDPTQLAARIGIIESLLHLKKFDVARADAERLLVTAEGIEASAAHELLARIALARRRYEAARTAAKEAQADNPSRPVIAYVEGRIAFDQRRFADALASFEAAEQTLAEHNGGPLADLRLYTAETLIHLDRLSEAEYLLLQELKAAPRATRARQGLVSVYNATGRTDEAAALARP